MYLKSNTFSYTDSWWKDLKIYNTYDAKCGSIMLQEHTGGNTGIIGFARAVGPWSSRNHKYRVVFRPKKIKRIRIRIERIVSF